MRYFYERARDGSRFCAVTDPGSPLVELARERGFRHVFEADPETGGRYSVLSPFGLRACRAGGRDHRGDAPPRPGGRGELRAARHGLGQLGALARCRDGRPGGARPGQAHVRCVEPIPSFGLWVEQLIAESTGKHGKGILPVAGELLGDPDVYGEDRVFAYLRNPDEPDKEPRRTDRRPRPRRAPHRHACRPWGGGPRGIFFSEFATAVAGWALGINPFDQPNVQEAKDNTAKVLAAGDLPDVEAGLARRAGRRGAACYVAIMGYVQPPTRSTRR